jgi:hypothetical protein
MEVALRRRLEGVAHIAISQSEQTASVTFDAGGALFSPEDFRAAVAEASVEVLTITVEACGIVHDTERGRWLMAGRNRFLLRNAPLVPVGIGACVAGALYEHSAGPQLDVGSTNALPAIEEDR